MKQVNNFFLSGFFFVIFLIVEFTDIYGNPGWFKAFVLISAITFFIMGISNRKKNNNEKE